MSSKSRDVLVDVYEMCNDDMRRWQAQNESIQYTVWQTARRKSMCLIIHQQDIHSTKSFQTCMPTQPFVLLRQHI